MRDFILTSFIYYIYRIINGVIIVIIGEIRYINPLAVFYFQRYEEGEVGGKKATQFQIAHFWCINVFERS